MARESAIYSLGLPPTFSKLETDANYYTERFSYECSMNLNNLMGQGFVFSQAESGDFSAFRAALSGWDADIENWYADAYAALEAGEEVPVPPDPPVVVESADGLPELIIWIGLELLKILLRNIGKPKDTSDGLFVEEDGEKKKILEIFGLSKDQNGKFYSLLWALAKSKLRITLESAHGLESLEYEDSLPD